LRCNYRCFFCHLEGVKEGGGELSPHEWGLIALALRSVGVETFKFTGGEPLVRDDIVDVVREVSTYGKPRDLSMTTNGYYLKEYAGALRDAGLTRLNVSLHSLKEEVYRRVTGCGNLSKVLEGIHEALNYDYRKIKLNVTVMQGINDGEVWDIIDYASRYGLHVQLIEFYPQGKGTYGFDKYHKVMDNIVKQVEEVASKVVIRGELHNRPIYYLPTGITVEVVKPIQNPIFCAACSRIRVAPDGKLKPCISSNLGVDTADILKSQVSDELKIKSLIERIKQVNMIREPHNLWPVSKYLELEYLNMRNNTRYSHSLSFRIRQHAH